MTIFRLNPELLDELVTRTQSAPPGGSRTINRDRELDLWSGRLKAIRLELGCSQREFADRYGIELRTLQNWEQKGRLPDKSSKALITLIEKVPDHVRNTLAEAKKKEPEMA